MRRDRKDACGIAQLMRLGWFRSVHCKSLPAQEVRALLTARKLVQAKLHDIEMSLRGILRGFGLKVGKTTSRRFDDRVRELVEGQPAGEGLDPGRWGMAVAKRAGRRKAKVALARKLAVVLHRMLADGAPFVAEAERAAPAAAA